MKYADNVQESCATLGTGSLSLSGAVVGSRSFAAAVTDGDLASGDEVAYRIKAANNAWEVGRGLFTAPSTLSRAEVYSSSNAGALVDLASTSRVFIVQAAVRIVDSATVADIDAPSLAAQNQAVWYVSGAGDPLADGTTEARVTTPTSMLARTGGVARVAVTINIIGDVPDAMTWKTSATTLSASLLFRGRKTTILADRVVTAIQPWAVGTFGEMTVAGVDASHVGKLCILTSGTFAGHIFLIVEHLGAGRIVFSPAASTIDVYVAEWGNPANGDTFTIYDVPRIGASGYQSLEGNGQTWADVRFGNPGGSHGVRTLMTYGGFSGCIIHGLDIVVGSSPVLFACHLSRLRVTEGKVDLYGCLLTDIPQVLWGQLGLSDTFVSGTGILVGTTGYGGNRADLVFNPTCTLGLPIKGSSVAIDVQQLGTVDVVLGRVWGDPANIGVRLDAGARFVYSVALPPAVGTPATGAFLIGPDVRTSAEIAISGSHTAANGAAVLAS